MRSASPALLALLLAGCGFGPPLVDPGPIVIPDDDDDSAIADDDDDQTGDDDDQTAASDLVAWGVLVQTHQLSAGGIVTESSARALAAFDAGSATQFGDPGGWDGLPLPGATLHPEQWEGGQGCVLLTSASTYDPLPSSAPVGGIVQLLPTTAGTTLELGQSGGLYSWSGAGPLDAEAYSIGVKGGTDWPPTTITSVLELPELTTGLLPGPGTLGNLQIVELKWDPRSDSSGVEILMFRWTTANQTAWSAIRCRAEDDGSHAFEASTLAAGSGDIIMSVSRAAWVTDTDGLQVDGRELHPHLGAITTVTYAMTPGR